MSRYGFGTYEEQRPVTWWRGYPLFASHFIVVGFVVSMLATTVAMFAQWGPQLDWLTFRSPEVLRGQIWRVVSYGLVNPPSLPFALDMLMIVWFGREVERFLGRRLFLLLLAGIYLVKPLLFTVLGFWMRRSFAGEAGAFALFVAFATLFPNTPLLFNILAKWAALVLVAILGLMALAARDGAGLLELGATCGFAFAFVRVQQGEWVLPRLRLPRRRPRLRVLPDLEPPAAPRRATPAAAQAAAPAKIDALLDKIAASGIKSLTPAELAQLEAARADLLKRGSGRR